MAACSRQNIVRRHVVRWTRGFIVILSMRQSAARLAESEFGKGEMRKTREWSSAKVARESEVLILLRGGYDPCYFSQRHNPPLSFATWPDHTLLENVQIHVTPVPRVPAFRRLSSYIAHYYFPIFFAYEAFSIPDNFITTKLVQWSSVLMYFVLSNLYFLCVNKKKKTTKNDKTKG